MIRPFLRCLFSVLIVVGVGVCPLSATTFYVATDGNDAWTGRLERPNAQGTDGPLASLTAARDVLRKLKSQGPLREPVEVLVATGVYPLETALVLEPQDSGTADFPIIYRAAKDAKPLLSGGRKISGFEKGENGIWKAYLPEAAAGRWNFSALYINGRRATRARTPNESYHYIQGVAAEMPRRAFMADPSDMALLASLSKEDLQQALVVAYHAWENSLSRIESLDSATNKITLVKDLWWPFDPNNVNAKRYHIENIKAALDAPGEWFLDRSGDLYYIPLPNEDMTQAEVYAPAIQGLLTLVGNPQNGQFIEHVTLEGLNFEYAEYAIPADGLQCEQAACRTPSAIVFHGARSVKFLNSEVSHVGGYAIQLVNGCSDCLIQHCLIQDMGAGGIRVDASVFQNAPTENCTIDNNIIRSGGHLDRGGIGVWLCDVAKNRVSHNDISDMYYTGISIGWVWGYGPSNAHHNTIEYNHVHHIGLGVLSDMGGIYTLGISPGTVVRNNVVHDVYAYHYGGWGLYTDEGSTGILLENNLVYRVKTGGFHQHYGRENIFRNNIFADSLYGQIHRTRVEEHLSFTFSNNIVYWHNSWVLNGPWQDPNVKLVSNLYCNASGEPILFDKLDFAAWQALGKDAGSMVADPKFVDPEHGDFHLQPDSPAFKIGFVPFDYTQAGVYGDEGWKKEAASFTYPPLPEILRPE